ncbi:MAG: type VI secretion system contractile sheath large subunit [Pseudomonadota bacterium]
MSDDTDHSYAPDFGSLEAEAFTQPEAGKSRFRIAVLGDFSGRGNRGDLETGADLAARKGQKLDVDSFDDVIARFATTLTLPLGPEGEAVEIEMRELDQLHPDELVDNLEVFEELVNLRGMVKSGMKRTLSDLADWGEEFGHLAPPKKKGRRKKAGAVPSRKLSDFASLIGDDRPAPELAETDELIQRIVAPYVVDADSEDKPAMLAAVDTAISAAMRRVLHHPDFQTLEASWRTLDLLARRIETDAQIQIAVYDVAAEELAADLSAAEDLTETGLFGMLAEKPVEDDAAGAFGLVIGLYSFEESPPHAELLGRMARIAAHIGAPFVTSITTDFLAVKPEDRHPLTAAAWDGLKALPEAAYLGLASPRFLLRHPYGAKTDPVDAFDFEEFTMAEGIGGMLMANPAALVSVLLAATLKQGGKSPELGKVMTLDDVPFHYITDSDGDQVALPTTERLLSQSTASAVVARGYMPVLSVKGQNVVRLGSFNAVGGGTLKGPWEQGLAIAASAVGVSVAMGSAVEAPERPAASSADEDLDLSSDDDDDVDGGDLDDLLSGLDSDDDDAGEDSDLDDLLAGLDDDGDDGDDASDSDLDDLLAGLDDDESDDDGDGDDDLDALLAGLEEDDDDDGDDDMDPELKALLEDL